MQQCSASVVGTVLLGAVPGLVKRTTMKLSMKGKPLSVLRKSELKVCSKEIQGESEEDRS